MAAKSECVKHALLSLAASYVLDYTPAENLRRRANLHHRRTITLLNEELAKKETYQRGGEEVAVCALSILSQQDVSLPTFCPPTRWAALRLQLGATPLTE